MISEIDQRQPHPTWYMSICGKSKDKIEAVHLATAKMLKSGKMHRFVGGHRQGKRMTSLEVRRSRLRRKG